MERPKCDIAGSGIFHQYAEAVNIEHFGESQRFALHLLVDAVDVFFAAGDFGVDMFFFELLTDGFEYFVDHLATIAPRNFECLGQHGVAIRMQMLETEIL